MKKVSKFTLCGIIVVLVFLLVIQGLVIHSKQKEIETAKLEYSVSKEMYDNLEKYYDKLNEDYNDLREKCTNLVNSLKPETTEPASTDNEQLPAEPVAPSSQENNTYTEMLPEQVEYYYTSNALENKVFGYYLSGEWDGTPTTIDGQFISLNEDGKLLINNRSVAPTGFCYNHSLDLPPLLENAFTQVFILDDGTYRLENNRIIKYSKGKEVNLSGGTLDWTGMNLAHYRPYSTDFSYDEENDKLYLIASAIPYDFTDKELKRNAGIFLYTIPDRSKSEIEFVGEIRYTDIDGDFKYDESNISNIREIFNPEEIFNFEFSRTCAFADGYIRDSEAFPEGTFTHPVTTTPSVSLGSYQG